MSYATLTTTDKARKGESTKERTISSVEVAEMIGKEHKNLIRDVRSYIAELGQLKIEPSDFFKESTYKNRQNKIMPCFLVTKKGSEILEIILDNFHSPTVASEITFEIAHINMQLAKSAHMGGLLYE